MRSVRTTTWLVASLGWAASSCAPTPFPDASLVSSVRILASSADPPYAKPGALVRVRVLAFDGRANKTEPMNIFWLPFVCKDPPNDAYYACFAQFGAGAGSGQEAGAPGGMDAGAGVTLATGCDAGLPDAAAIGVLTAGADLTSILPQGNCVDFVMPSDAITAHSSNPSPQVPYGLAILFNVACAGHLELVPRDPNNIQSAPIGCFDAQHNRLGPSDYVLGFTRVFAYDMLENANPEIDAIEVDVDGQVTDLDFDGGTEAGFDVDHCPDGSKCTSVHVGPIVPTSSQEPNPLVHDVNNHELKEQIWAEFFSTLGSFGSDARLLYDPATGSVGTTADTNNEFDPPDHAGDGTIWIVVHDNRGGATWASLPVRVH
jgi:hypothetical protein